MGLLLYKRSQPLYQFGGCLQMLSVSDSAATTSYLACKQQLLYTVHLALASAQQLHSICEKFAVFAQIKQSVWPASTS